MKSSRFRTLLLGVAGGTIYAFLCLKIVTILFMNVSITFIFIVPLVIGTIPVLFSTREQLRSYFTCLVIPFISTLLFFALCLLSGFEGLICLSVIIVPFTLLGALGAFIASLIRLRTEKTQTPLYSSLLLPVLFLLIEYNLPAPAQIGSVRTSMVIHASPQTIWQNIKNIRNIESSEIQPHFIHMVMHIPKPLNGELTREGTGGIRNITWEKGIRFREKIKDWQEEKSFSYNIEFDPLSVPPRTLDEHVMIGGKYFDVLEGSYQLVPLDSSACQLTLSCTYRVNTTLNAYSSWWAGLVLNDFNEMILEVVQRRCEQKIALPPAVHPLQ